MSTISSNTDVMVGLGIGVDREGFSRDVAAIRAEFETFRQSVISAVIEIPVRLRNEATAQLSTIMQQLQAQASAGINIPVNVAGGGGGGLGSTPFPAFSGGSDRMSLASLAVGGAGGGFVSGPRFAGSSSFPDLPQFNSNAIRGIQNEANQFYSDQQWKMGPAQAADEGQGGGSGSGMMGGLRLFAAAHLALSGIEDASRSYQYYSSDLYARKDMPELDRLKQLRKESEENNSGATGAGRRSIAWLLRNPFRSTPFDPATDPGLVSRFDDASEIRGLTGRITAEERESKDVSRLEGISRMREGMQDHLADAQGQLEVQSTSGAEQRAAEIRVSTQRMIEAFSKQADAMKDAAEKLTNQADRTRAINESAAFRAQGVRVAESIGASESARAGTEQILQGRETGVLQRIAAGDYRGAAQEQRAIRDARLAISMGVGSPEAIARQTAQDNLDVAQDQLRGSRLDAATHIRQLRMSGDHYGASIEEAKLTQADADKTDPFNAAAHARSSDTYAAAAQQNEALRLLSVRSAITSANEDNPYSAQRIRIRDEYDRNVLFDSAHAADYASERDAGLARIGREQTRRDGAIVLANRGAAEVINLAHGNPRRGIARNPQLAQAEALRNQEIEELTAHATDGDDVLGSIRQKYRAEAEQMLRHTADTRARITLGMIQTRRIQPLGTVSHADGGGPGANPNGAAARVDAQFARAVDKFDKLMDKLAKTVK